MTYNQNGDIEGAMPCIEVGVQPTLSPVGGEAFGDLCLVAIDRPEVVDIVVALSPQVPHEDGKRARSVLEVGRTGSARKRPPLPCGGSGPLVLDTVVGAGGHLDGGLADLTVGDTLLVRSTRGRWSAVADSGGLATLSRIVDNNELARNTGRIPAFGLCGYLALQWAAAGALYDSEWADLRVEASRVRMDLFLTDLLVGCDCARVRRKLQLVQASLRYASSPWHLNRESGGWLDIGDLCHLCIDFPLVVWGADMGNGHRRVRFPLSGNVPVGGPDAGRLAASPGQIILDSDHFFPLDQVEIGERADEVVEAVCVAGHGGSPGVPTPVTLLGVVGECCGSEAVVQRDEAELQLEEASLQHEGVKVRLVVDRPVGEAATPTEGSLTVVVTPVGESGDATGGRTSIVRPRRLRKRGADVASPDLLGREKRRRLDTPAWGPASGGSPSFLALVTLEGVVGGCCGSEAVLQRDEAELQREEATMQRDGVEVRLVPDRPVGEAAAPTEGSPTGVLTPVEESVDAPGGRASIVRPRRWLRKRGADVAFPDRLSRLEKRRRLVTPAWGPASEEVEADPPE